MKREKTKTAGTRESEINVSEIRAAETRTRETGTAEIGITRTGIAEIENLRMEQSRDHRRSGSRGIPGIPAVVAAVALGILLGMGILTGCSRGGNPVQESSAATTDSQDNAQQETESGQQSQGSNGQEQANRGKENQSQESQGQEQEAQDMNQKLLEGLSFPEFTQEEYPVVDGSTATLPLSIALYQHVTGVTEEQAAASIHHSKTNQSYINLQEGSADLVLAYEPSADSYDMTDPEGALQVAPIGKDALVFLANVGNPVTSLRDSQLIAIYQGKIRNWRMVGGENRELVAFQRPSGSGSQTMMEKLVMRGEKIASAPTEQVAAEMGDLIDDLASYSNTVNALGYSVYFYARNMYYSPGLRFMAVDGVMPDNKSIQSGEYPYVNDFYAAIRKDEPADSPAHVLFDWLTGKEGQRFVGSVGYVPAMSELEISGTEGVLPQPFLGGGSVELPEDTCILLDGREFYNEDCSVLLDGSFQEVKRIYGVQPAQMFSLANTGKPVIMKESTSQRYGLYDLKKETWVSEPEYEVMYPLENEEDGYEGTLYDYEKEIMVRFRSVKGKETREEKNLYLQEMQVGDRIWRGESQTDYSAFSILDENENYLRSINLAGDDALGEFLFLDSNDYYLFAHYLNGCIVLDKEGDLVLNREMLGDALEPYAENTEGEASLYLENILNSPEFVLGNAGDSSRVFVYDLVNREILSQPGDIVETEAGYYSWYEWDPLEPFSNSAVWHVKRAGGEEALYDGREQLFSRDGHPFTCLLGEGIYAWQRESDGKAQEEKELVVEDTGSGEQYTYPLELMGEEGEFYSWIQAGRQIAEQVFVLQDRDDHRHIYRGEQLLAEGKTVWYFSSEDGQYVFITQSNEKGEFHGGRILRTSDGETIKELEDSMVPYDAAGPVLLYGQGDYLYFSGFTGEYGLRLLNNLDNELLDD